ncbi:MAG: hypothetical protein DRP42_00275 [Tenericutes bacterium]|nr:MAG: hypothetical protein DRP42_00275 [Mycoplasmatota bacterium]
MFDKLSFSQFVKKDILMSNRNETETSLLLKAFLRMSSTFELDQILIRIPNNDLTPALKKLIEKEYSISLKETLFKRYSVLISENKKFIKEVKDYIDIPLMNNNAEYSSYIAGLFLAKGSINSPTTSSYNFEIRAKEITKALDVRELFEAMGIVVKIRQKNN